MRVQWRSITSPVGPLTVAECPEGPVVVAFAPTAGARSWASALRARDPSLELELGPCPVASAHVEAYFAGTPLPFALDDRLARLHGFSPAQVALYRAMLAIPFGETRAYDDLARATGLIARQVGQLAGSNPLPLLVPCHRVVGKRGDLVGFGGGLPRKQWLLDFELRTTGLVLR